MIAEVVSLATDHRLRDERHGRDRSQPSREFRGLFPVRGKSHETTTTVFSGASRSAVRMVLDQQHQHESQLAAIMSIATKAGCTQETLRRWVRKSERDTGVREGPPTDERARVKELERELRQLRQAHEILRKASAFSPRRNSTAHHGNDCLCRF